MNEVDKSLIRVCDVRGETRGTGFVVSDSLAVTCAHVVEACGGAPGGRVRGVFHLNKEVREAEVVSEFWRASDADDIAVLRVEGGMPHNVTPVRLGRTSGTDDHRCATLGYPRVGALQGVEGRGEIYRSVREANGRRLIQLTSREITAGFSGAPLLDQGTGRVVGMMTTIAQPDRYGRMGETAFATPAEILHQLILPLCPDLRLHLPQAVEEYLRAVAQFCRDLPYVSLKSGVSLETVYVREQIRQETPEGPRTSDEETAGKELAARELRARPMTVTQALEQHPRLVVAGGAGAGKSTLLRHLVQGLADGSSDWHPHLPILVSLRGLAEREGELTTILREQVRAELGIRLLTPLPDSFLIDWASQTGMPWLIALDGLDEIVDGDRCGLLIHELIQAAWPPGSHVFMTTRPGMTALPDGFTSFDLLPFEPKQVEEFAHNWFKPDDAKAYAFLESVRAARMGDLSGTPLLLTVAATVFEHPNASSLKGLRRSKLYSEFVRILLDEDAAPNRHMKEQFCKEFRTDLGERLFDYRREVLESIALALQEERGVRDALIECLRDVVGWSAQDAARKADAVLKILVQQRAGLVVLRGDRYEFIHPSFREYLAAAALVRACGSDLEKVWDRVISHWKEENWHEVALFALGILSDKDTDVASLLERIWKGGEGDLSFAVHTLAGQVRVADDWANQVLDTLRTQVGDPTALRISRYVAGYRLMEIGRANDLLTLASDEIMPSDLRVRAAMRLGMLGEAEEASRLLLGLARHPIAEHLARWAVDALMILGRAEDLLVLACDPTIKVEGRLSALQALLEQGLQANGASPIQLTLAHDPTVEATLRQLFVEGLEIMERFAQDGANKDIPLAVQDTVKAIRQLLSGWSQPGGE